YRKARGISEDAVEPPGEPKSISKETTFSEDIEDAHRLERELIALGERVASRTRHHGLRARRVTLKLRYADFRTVTRARMLEEGTDLDAPIREVVLGLLRGVLAKGGRPRIRFLGVSLSALSRSGEQLSLFGHERREQLEALTRKVDEVRERYGFGSVRSGRSLGRAEEGEEE
ncbi:MAG: DNA polymerase IV, partial [Nitrospinota bacterium]